MEPLHGDDVFIVTIEASFAGKQDGNLWTASSAECHEIYLYL